MINKKSGGRCAEDVYNEETDESLGRCMLPLRHAGPCNCGVLCALCRLRHVDTEKEHMKLCTVAEAVEKLPPLLVIDVEHMHVSEESEYDNGMVRTFIRGYTKEHAPDDTVVGVYELKYVARTRTQIVKTVTFDTFSGS